MKGIKNKSANTGIGMRFILQCKIIAFRLSKQTGNWMKSRDKNEGLMQLSLRKQVGAFLEKKIKKQEEVSTSDWAIFLVQEF